MIRFHVQIVCDCGRKLEATCLNGEKDLRPEHDSIMGRALLAKWKLQPKIMCEWCQQEDAEKSA